MLCTNPISNQGEFISSVQLLFKHVGRSLLVIGQLEYVNYLSVNHFHVTKYDGEFVTLTCCVYIYKSGVQCT